MTDESMAQAATRNYLPVGDESYADHLCQNMAEAGALSHGEKWRLPFPELFGASLGQVLDTATADLATAFATLGQGDQMSRLVVFATKSQEISAQYNPKADGTGLVVVSDSLVALCNTYCQHVGQALAAVVDTSSLLKFFLRLAVVHIKGTLGGEPSHLAALLRYHHAKRRGHGVATALVTQQDLRDQETSSHHGLADLYLMLAIRFFLGHEMAHHALAHQTECAESPEQESQADLLALRAGNLAYASELKQEASAWFVRDKWLEDAGEFYGLVSAVIAMQAVQSLEDGLMVRRSRTHLPARDRADRLIELSLGDDRIREHECAVGGRDASFRKRIESERYLLEILTTSLMEATDKASDFGVHPAGFNWTALPAAQVVAPSAAHLRDVARLDRLLGQPSEALAAALAQSPLHDGSLYATAGDTRRAMSTWGVPDVEICAAHDESVGLAFYALVYYIRSASKAHGLIGTDLHELPLVAATLIARGMAPTSSG